MEHGLIWVLSVLFGGLIFRLVYERADVVAEWIVRAQCKMLPAKDRLKYEAEWLAIVHDVEGGAWKMVTALGFLSVALPVGSKKAVKIGRKWSYQTLVEISSTAQKVRILASLTWIVAMGLGTGLMVKNGFEFLTKILGN